HPTRHTSLAQYSPHPPPDLHSFPTRRSSICLVGEDARAREAHVRAERPRRFELLEDARVDAAILRARGSADPQSPSPSVSPRRQDRKSTRLNSSLLVITYASFCMK